MEEKFFVCDCGAEAIGLSTWDTDDKTTEVCLSFWSFGNDSGHYSWKDKMRHIWQIIKKGHPYTDSVILNAEKTKELGNLLLSIVEKSNA
jgi:hypothetical protein